MEKTQKINRKRVDGREEKNMEALKLEMRLSPFGTIEMKVEHNSCVDKRKNNPEFARQTTTPTFDHSYFEEPNTEENI